MRHRHRDQRQTETKLSFQRAGLRSSEHSFGSETGEQTTTVRPQSEVKQVRSAIGPLEEDAAELGGAGSPDSEVLIEMEEEAEEPRPLQRMNNPQDPSAGKRSHTLTYLPYRTWCTHCVWSRWEAAGRRCSTKARGIPEIALNYCFPGSEGQARIVILVARERDAQMTCAVQVPEGLHNFPEMRSVRQSWTLQPDLKQHKLGTETGTI